MWWRPPRRHCSSSSRRPASAAGTSGRACAAPRRPGRRRPPRRGDARPGRRTSGPEAIAALAGAAPLLDGIDLVTSSAAYRRLPGHRPAVPDRRRGRRRANRERGLGSGADAADGAAGPARRLADATRCHTLSPCLAPTERVIDMPTSRDTAQGHRFSDVTGLHGADTVRTASTGPRRSMAPVISRSTATAAPCAAPRLRRLRRQLPPRSRARGRRGHRRRRGARHAHARAGRARPDAALQLPGRLSGTGRPPAGCDLRRGRGVMPVVRGEAPPPRHQRLPAQGRWHPELPLGPVEPARPVLLRGPHRLLRRRGRRLRRRAGRAGHPHRTGARQDPLLPTPTPWPPCAPRSRSTRSTSSCSILRCHSASSGPTWASPTA